MKKSEKNAIIKWAKTLSNEQLEKEYYDSAFDSLGSQVEIMYERGYDMVDIIEREKHERFICERNDILRCLCEERGIKLWEQ